MGGAKDGRGGATGTEMGRRSDCVTNKWLWGGASVVLRRTQINTAAAFEVQV